MNLMPDNFFYFITLFTLAMLGGTYMLFTYKKSWINYLMAVTFYLCAFRACSEYYLQQLAEYEHAVLLMKYHGTLTSLISFSVWSSLFYAVKPFKNEVTSEWKRHLFAFVFFAIPTMIFMYHMFQRNMFVTNTVKLDGYWTFKNTDHWSLAFYNIYAYRIGVVFLVGLFVYGIITDRSNRLKKTFLAAAFIVIPLLTSTLILGQQSTQWKIPNICLILLIQTYIISWFISGYRLFDDGFDNASQDLLNSISDLSIQTDLNYTIINTNSQFTDYFSSDKTDIYQFITESSRLIRQEVNDLIAALNKTNKVEQHEISLLDKDQNERLFRITMSDLIWRGKKNGYTFLLSDLTELKNKEQELQQMNSTKDQIFSILGHDLRKPAIAFRGITRKINYLIGKKDYNSLSHLGNSIEKSALQLNALIDNILKWALSQKDEIDIKEQDVSIKQLTDDLIKSFELITSQKSITIDNGNIDDDHIIYTDPDILKTILRNLVDNSIKYSESKSTVRLDTKMENEKVLIRVKDQGVGMTKDQLGKLFNLYKDKSEQGTRGEQGSGLGLNLVYDLVQRTGGQIKCSSEVGKGTEFELIYQ